MNSTQQIWWNPNIICASLHLSFVLFFVAIIILLERLETVLARDLPSTNRAACKKHGGFEDSKETGCTPWFYTIPVKSRYKKTCTSNHFRHISPSCQTSRLVTNIQRLSPQSPEAPLIVWSLDDIHTEGHCNATTHWITLQSSQNLFMLIPMMSLTVFSFEKRTPHLNLHQSCRIPKYQWMIARWHHFKQIQSSILICFSILDSICLHV